MPEQERGESLALADQHQIGGVFAVPVAIILPDVEFAGACGQLQPQRIAEIGRLFMAEHDIDVLARRELRRVHIVDVADHL